MSFRNVNFASIAKFNSATSSQLLNLYEGHVINKLKAESSKPKSKTFAPSSFRCERKCWFRLRGASTDTLETPDLVLNFCAELGTAIHLIVQQNLAEALGDDWVDVEDYLTHCEPKYPYDYTLSHEGMECKIELTNPPVRFACDGIIRLNGKLYLLEIKTSEYASWKDLTDPKSIHMDQIKCYATLLGLSDVIVMYIDRQYGDIKVYEIHVGIDESKQILNKFKHIQDMVEYNLAPARLPDNDYMCSNCEYRKKCKDWG